MQSITTSRGTTHSIRYMVMIARYPKRLAIVLIDERPLSQIAADFEGVETLAKTDDAKPGLKELYEGYTTLVSIGRIEKDGTVRITLENGNMME